VPVEGQRSSFRPESFFPFRQEHGFSVPGLAVRRIPKPLGRQSQPLFRSFPAHTGFLHADLSETQPFHPPTFLTRNFPRNAVGVLGVVPLMVHALLGQVFFLPHGGLSHPTSPERARCLSVSPATQKPASNGGPETRENPPQKGVLFPTSVAVSFTRLFGQPRIP